MTDQQTRKWWCAAALAIALIVVAGVASADPPDCAEDPPYDVYGTHYKVSLEDAARVFRQRGYVVRDIAVEVESINCNDGRTYAYHAYLDCKCRYYEQASGYDATIGDNCRVYKWRGEYIGQPDQAACGCGDLEGYGRNP